MVFALIIINEKKNSKHILIDEVCFKIEFFILSLFDLKIKKAFGENNFISIDISE